MNGDKNSGGEGEDLNELLTRLWQLKRLILITTVAVSLPIAVVAFVMSDVWEVSAALQIGQIGQVGQVGQRPVEAIEIAVERVKSRHFLDEILSEAGLREKAARNFFYKTLSVKPVKGTAFIEIKVQGSAPNETASVLQIVADRLQKIHQELAAPVLKKLATDLKTTKERISDITESQEKIWEGRKTGQSLARLKHDETLLLTNLDYQQKIVLSDLLNQKTALEVALSATQTFPTRFVSPPLISEEPVAPKRLMIVIIGVIAGLLAGVILALIVRSRRGTDPTR